MAKPQKTPAHASPYDAIRPQVSKLLADKAYKHALTLLSEIYKSLPPTAMLMDDMATCYWNLGDATTALKLGELAAENARDSAVAWGKLGAMALSTGDRTLAETALKRSLRVDPKFAKSLAALNRVTPLARTGRQADILRAIAKSPKAPAFDRALARNTLGQIEQAASNTKSAFYHYGKSKAHGGGTFDPAVAEAYVDAQCSKFVPKSPPPARQNDRPRFVFVVGMPRSGTTLVESILTRHPQVGTVGETPALMDCVRLCRKRTGEMHGWDWVDALTQTDIDALSQAYIDRCAQHIVGDMPPVMIDKTPLNIFDVGFASRILPDARFVFMSRHPLDVGLSNYSTPYLAPHAFSKTPQNIGQMTRALFRSAQDYRDKLGTDFRWQSYAALVKSSKAQIPELVDQVGLPWDPRCLSPEDRTGAVNTASFLQVRSAINAKGLGKWEAFREELGPMVEALGGWEWIDRWAAEDDALCAQAASRATITQGAAAGA